MLAALCALMLGAPAAHAGEGSGPTAVVTLGDSYISGEAGRWAGNSTSPTPGNDGTDRACRPAGPGCQVDASTVYVDGTAANGCHRSDVAEVLSASLPVAARVNLACSGAVTTNLVPAEGGGEGQNGEAPQGDQLATVARSHDVQAVVISIGGNDLGFASIIAACLQAYTAKTGPCKPSQQAKLTAAIPAATEKVVNVIDAVRAVMNGAGYDDRGYRLILQTYPSVAPRAAENRFAEDDPQRTNQGCANYDVDLDWARDEASKQIGDMVVTAARARGAEVLDLHGLFQGHEVCSKTAAESTPFAQPGPAGAEWGRFTGGSTVAQGQLQEAFHPNAYGQRAFGTCLTAVYAAAPGEFACTGAAGITPDAVTLRRTGDASPLVLPASAGAGKKAKARRLRLTYRRVHRGRRAVCVRFRVRSGGKAVRRATVRFAGGRRRTGRSGRVTICRRVGAGKRRASARKAGYKPSRRTVRIRHR